MRDSRSYSLYPSDLNLSAAYGSLFAYLGECKYTEARDCDNISFRLVIDDSRRLSGKSVKEFLTLIERFPHATSVATHFHWERSTTDRFGLGVDVTSSQIDVWVESDDLNTIAAIHEKAREFFLARNPVPEKSASVSRRSLRKTIFLAHRFDPQGRSVASTLCKFLRRLSFDVIEGEGYDSQNIPDKVSARIRSQDVFICLVTPGDPSWLLSEAAFAKALEKHIIILMQDHTTLNRGIIGQDFEHIPFPDGGIEKAFSELIYALP